MRRGVGLGLHSLAIEGWEEGGRRAPQRSGRFRCDFTPPPQTLIRTRSTPDSLLTLACGSPRFTFRLADSLDDHAGIRTHALDAV